MPRLEQPERSPRVSSWRPFVHACSRVRWVSTVPKRCTSVAEDRPQRLASAEPSSWIETTPWRGVSIHDDVACPILGSLCVTVPVIRGTVTHDDGKGGAKGRLVRADDRIERSRVLYERALFEGDAVASNMVGLIYVAAGQGRRDDALALIAEAGALARASGAHGITRQIEEASAALDEPQ
jgi:hypothetical protein